MAAGSASGASVQLDQTFAKPSLELGTVTLEDWVFFKVNEELGASPAAAKPIELWTAEDADCSVEGTLAALTRYQVHFSLAMSAEELREKILRPTPQFVWRVACAVHEATGFLPRLPSEWPTSKEEKLDLFWHIRVRVSGRLGLNPVDVSPLEVMHCRNREKTRWLLQLLAIAAAKEAIDAKFGLLRVPRTASESSTCSGGPEDTRPPTPLAAPCRSEPWVGAESCGAAGLGPRAPAALAVGGEGASGDDNAEQSPEPCTPSGLSPRGRGRRRQRR